MSEFVNPFGNRMGAAFMILSHMGQAWVAKWVGNPRRAIGGQSVGIPRGGGTELVWYTALKNIREDIKIFYALILRPTVPTKPYTMLLLKKRRWYRPNQF